MLLSKAVVSWGATGPSQPTAFIEDLECLGLRIVRKNVIFSTEAPNMQDVRCLGENASAPCATSSCLTETEYAFKPGHLL